MIPKIEVKEHPNFRTINVNGIYGGHRPMYFEIILYSDELVANEALSSIEVASERSSVKRTLECRLIIDPFQAKTLHDWLGKHIADFEKIFGRVSSPEELSDKFGKSDLK